MQLIVLGMHRSGTSVLARLLNLMGAYFGPEGASTGANPENPKGFWERRDVRMLNDHVLQSVGCDWNRVLAFDPDRLPDALSTEFVQRASRLVLEMDAHRPWLLKEPRLCLLFGLWRKVLDIPACIHIHRHPVEVAASLQARNNIPMPSGLALWERYVRSALSSSSGLPAVMVSHRQLMQQPYEALERLWLGLAAIGETGLRMPSRTEVAAFVRDDLYRQRERRDDLLAWRNAPQVRLFERLTDEGQPVRGIVDPMGAASERALEEYEASLPPLKPKSGSSRPPVNGKPGQTNVQAGTGHGMDGHRPEVVLPSGARHEPVPVEKGAPNAVNEHAHLVDALKRAENAAITAEQRLAERFCETGKLTRILLERDASITQLQSAQDALAKARDTARTTCTELQSELDAARKTLVEANGRLATAMHQLNDSRTEATDQAARLRTLEAMLCSTGARAARSERELARITYSMAWKITGPLRVISRWLGRRRTGPGTLSSDVEAIRTSGLFDAAWYLRRNSDVAQNGGDAALHYLEHGALEWRDPGPAFDTGYYLASNPDVAAAGTNPLLHFIRHGRHEGRLPRAGAGACDPE